MKAWAFACIISFNLIPIKIQWSGCHYHKEEQNVTDYFYCYGHRSKIIFLTISWAQALAPSRRLWAISWLTEWVKYAQPVRLRARNLLLKTAFLSIIWAGLGSIPRLCFIIDSSSPLPSMKHISLPPQPRTDHWVVSLEDDLGGWPTSWYPHSGAVSCTVPCCSVSASAWLTASSRNGSMVGHIPSTL